MFQSKKFLNNIKPVKIEQVHSLNLFYFLFFFKFLINNNNKHIEEYFNNIILDCLVEKEDYSKLTNFDKFCAHCFFKMAAKYL